MSHGDQPGTDRDVVVGGSEDLSAENEALRERCARLEAVVDVLSDAAFVKDEGGRYLLINAAGARLIGRTVGEVVGKFDGDLFAPESARTIVEFDQEILAGRSTSVVDQTLTTGGVTRNYETVKRAYRDGEGRVVGIVGVARDVTEARRVEAERDGLMERLGLQIDRLPLGYILLDAEDRVLDWNPVAEKLFGYTKGEALGHYGLDLIGPRPVNEQLQKIVRRVRAGDMNANSVNENRTKDGRVITCEWFNTPLVDTEGRYSGLIALVQDVTEPKKIGEALEVSRRRFQAVFDNSLDGILLMDDSGRYVDANPSICQLLGYRREELVRATVQDITPAEDLGEVSVLMGQFLAAGTLDGEYTLLCKDGTTRETEYRAVANILPGLHLAVHRDVTDRKRAERELRDREERVRLLLDSTGEAIYGSDLDGLCTFCNPACVRLLGYADAGDLLGEAIHGLIQHSRADGTPYPREECKIQRAVRRGEGVHFEEEVFWRADGTSFPAEAWAHPVRRGGEVVGSVVTFVDISDRKRAEQDLRDYAERLKVVSKRVIEVQEEERRHIARELHDEIGQILSAIGLNVHAAKRVCDKAAWPYLDECLGIVEKAVQQVRGLALDLRPSMLDDLGWAAALRWLVKRQAERAGLAAHFGVKSSGAVLAPDLATACFRVAQEALTNVVKHAKARAVWVDVREGDGEVELMVRDDGVGFDSEEARRRAGRGESLGLLGLQERAGLFGGRVEIDSAPGRGSTLRIWFPVTREGDDEGGDEDDEGGRC